ncbi:LOB domain-containing protein 36 [Linum grandiflorum]
MEMAPAASHNSPCAACKFLRRKCTSECVFAPYFPPEQPSKFATVHRVFGASNIAKILNELPVSDREDAVTSLFYEADARLRDPVYGCVGYISHLQQRLKELHFNLESARRQLSCFVSPPPPIAPNFNANPTPFPQQMIGSGVPPSVPGPMINNNNLQQQQQFHNLMQVNEMQQQMGPSSATAQQEMIMRAYDQQLQQLQQEAICRGGSGDGSVTLAGYNNQIGNLQQENHQHHHMGVSPISLAIGREIHNGSSTVAATAVGGNHHDDDEGRFQLFLQQPQQQERAEDQEVAGRSRSNVTGP